MALIGQADLDKWFAYPPPQPGQQEKYIAIRDKAKEFAELIVTVCPECAETTGAILHLREVVMIANRAIGCYGAE